MNDVGKIMNMNLLMVL